MPNGKNPAPDSPSDIVLMRARRMMRRLKHQPFIALIVDEGHDRVHLYHTDGITVEAIAECRRHLDEIEAELKR